MIARLALAALLLLAGCRDVIDLSRSTDGGENDADETLPDAGPTDLDGGANDGGAPVTDAASARANAPATALAR